MIVKRLFLFISIIVVVILSAVQSESSDVIIIGDFRLKPINDIVTIIRETLPYESSVYLPKDVKGILNSIVGKEKAKIVISLGGEPTNDALSLPESVSLIYGLLVKPEITNRHNISGVFMTTPVSEYISLLARYFPNIRKLGIVLEPETGNVLLHDVSSSSVTLYRANNSYEFIKGVNRLSGNIDAFLLLPEKNLLSATAIEELYRRSFADKVPVIGVSEKHVKMGSLFAIVFDETGMGKQIGELAQKVLSRGNASGIVPSPPEKFNLYLNSETAKAMKMIMPAELVKKARVISMKSPMAILKALIFKYGTSFRRKALWVAIPGLIITSVVYTVDAVRTEKAIMKEEITKRAEVVAHLASRIGELPLLSGNPELMRNAILILKSVPEVGFVAFYNNKMELILKDGSEISNQRMTSFGPAIKIFEDNNFFDLYAPVFTVKAKEDFDIFQEDANRTDIRENAGWIRIGFSKASMKKQQQLIIFRGLIFAAIFTLAIGWLVYYMFTLATRPLTMLQKALGGVRKGQYPEIHISSNDEAGMLASEYNRMAEAVKDRESKLKDSEKRTRELFDRVDHAIFRMDKEGNIKETNRKFDALCGETGRFNELIAAGQKDISLKNLVDNLNNLEERIVGRNGEEIVVLMSLYPEFNEENMLVGFDGHFVDITEKKRLEEALFQTQKLESLGLLAGGVAHDFNNILTGILGYSSLMKHMVPEKDTMHGYLDTIQKSARRAAALAGQLLGFARKGKYKIETLCINDIANELSSFLQETFDRGIEIVLSTGVDLPPIEGDGTQIYQALLNLCINARDAMPDGGKLYIKTDNFLLSDKKSADSLQLQPGRYVRVYVTDTGLGIEPKVRDKIFEPFFTTKEVGKGTGLGLAMVYGIIKNHGGHIAVHSKQGLGTTMVICLPATEGVIEEKSQKILIEEMPDQGSILIIDDEEVIRILGKDILEVYGYEVHIAMNGVEGVKIFRELRDRINLVILDMVMPEKSGSQTFREIREIKADTKVIICSGYGKEYYIQESIEEGAAGFLQKPFHHMDLVTKVKEMIGGGIS